MEWPERQPQIPMGDSKCLVAICTEESTCRYLFSSACKYGGNSVT